MGQRRCAVEPLESRTLFAVSIVVDYTFDTNGFFSDSTRRTALEEAASRLSERLDDSLAALTPSGSNTVTYNFTNPTTGTAQQVVNPSISAGEIRIYVGARQLGTSTLGIGGGAGYSASGSQTWLNLLEGRGQAGALLADGQKTDFAPAVGVVTFDVDASWHFGLTTTGLTSSKSDFLSVAMHEIGHVLGINGGNDSWTRLISGGLFTGSSSVALYGAGVPVEGNAHFASGVMSPGEGEVAMDPEVTNGERKLFTALDFAALDDIGWDIKAASDPSLPDPVGVVEADATSYLEGATAVLSGASSSVAGGTITLYEWDTDYDSTSGVFVRRTTGPTVNLALGDEDGPGVRTVALRVTSSFGTQSVVIYQLDVANKAPSAQLNLVGDQLQFTNVSDVSGDVAAGFTYKVDIDDDGVFEYSGSSPNYTLPGDLAGADQRSFRARVMDKDGGFTDFTGNVTLPRVTVSLGVSSITLPEGGLGASITVNLTQALTQDVTVSYGVSGVVLGTDLAASGTSGQVVIPSGTTSATFVLAAAENTAYTGNRAFTLSITGTSVEAVVVSATTAAGTITENDAPVSTTTDTIGKKKIYATVTGTSGNDVITVAKGKKSTTIITVNGVATTVASNLQRIVVLGLAGDDVLTLASGISKPIIFSGGDGNDTATAGTGKDVLIGGAGADSLNGLTGEDLLVGGAIAGESDVGTLLGIQGVWIGKGKLAARGATLADTAGSLFSSSAVTDPTDDVLRGDKSNDFIVGDINDSLPLNGKKDGKDIVRVR